MTTSVGAGSLRVAAIVVSWNGLDLLTRSLAALAAQTRPFDRVIVVDNGSAGIENLTPWAGAADFQLVRMGENLGFAAANNRGLALCADCDFVALVNPDAFLAPDWLENMLVVARCFPTAASFASRLVQANVPALLDGAGDAYHASGLAWRIGYGLPVMTCPTKVHDVFSPCAAAALYRRAPLLDVGGFDERFFCYMEDVDLGFRLRLVGYRCLYAPLSVVYHVGSGTTGGKNSDFSVYHGHRNLVWTFVKNMPGVLFWLLLPLHVALNLMSIVWFALHGQGGVILRAKRDALLDLPKIWRKRQQIQKARVASIRDIWRVLDKRFLPIKRKI